MADKQDKTGRGGRWKRRAYWALGMLMLALAIVGAVLPVMPTTIFVILAAACFGRASPRWEAYLLQHPRFGPSLVAWREQGAISVRGKSFAVAGISLGLVVFWYTTQPVLWLGLLVSGFMAGCAIWVVSRPAPRVD
ncbi:YbaN family protein [Bordetella sp. BOR01]|uniref:YbaN family protein n=1 Tax=Bordetella sp. BOR01 TaxID=2854779 RepID=UPI001C4579B6|nr:YbaN family protein [Bordetella sp. BOR01]MBV7482639.1 YbaN family protein [Bordetella sp. BOR01]